MACSTCGTSFGEILTADGGDTLCRDCYEPDAPRQNGHEPADPTRRPQEPEAVAVHRRNDAGNARRFATQHRDRLRWVPPWRTWITWDGNRWQRDRDGEAMRAAKQTAITIFHEAADAADNEERKALGTWASRSESEQRLRAMLSLAQSEPGLSAMPEHLDSDPDLLSVANGTLDLRTGGLRPADPADLITRGTDATFDPDARCPRWQRFMSEVFDGDAELISYVHRFVGYALTGHTLEHVLLVLFGLGCNGKSVFTGTIRKLLGDLATVAAFDTFTQTRGDRGPRNDLARLDGARVVIGSETGAGSRLDEATVKEITGGDAIVARFLHKEYFEFQPQFKLCLVTNHRPRVDGGDDAIWRRLRLIPFEVSFTGREDRDLPATLEAEMPGILNWALEGCLKWRQQGLGTADAVEAATGDYRADEDVLGAFLAERCEQREDAEVPVADLRLAYENFCDEIGERALAGNVLGRELKKRGIGRSGAGRRSYGGVFLR